MNIWFCWVRYSFISSHYYQGCQNSLFLYQVGLKTLTQSITSLLFSHAVLFNKSGFRWSPTPNCLDFNVYFPSKHGLASLPSLSFFLHLFWTRTVAQALHAPGAPCHSATSTDPSQGISRVCPNCSFIHWLTREAASLACSLCPLADASSTWWFIISGPLCWSWYSSANKCYFCAKKLTICCSDNTSHNLLKNDFHCVTFTL